MMTDPTKAALGNPYSGAGSGFHSQVLMRAPQYDFEMPRGGDNL